MKDAIAYAHEAGFFSFNVIGWKSEFERLIASIRAEYEAPLKLAEEALVYHTRQTRPIHKTDEAIITIRNTLTYLVKTPDVLVSNGNWGGRLDFKCPVCGKEFVSHQAVYSHCQNECKTLVDQCSDANKIVAEQSIILDNPHPPHRLCECTACLEYWTPLPDCDAFAASGKPIAEPVKQEPVADESPRFETEDHDLTTLLELTVDIYSGICNHDTAVWWHETLGKVEAKLTPVDAKAIRAEALDKVVKFLSESGLITPTGRFAAAIRGLK